MANISLSSGGSKRKASTPVRSLSRESVGLESAPRSSPTRYDQEPGVLIRFIGEMTKIRDTSTFSLKILHEAKPGMLQPAKPYESPDVAENGENQDLNRPAPQKRSPAIILTLPQTDKKTVARGTRQQPRRQAPTPNAATASPSQSTDNRSSDSDGGRTEDDADSAFSADEAPRTTRSSARTTSAATSVSPPQAPVPTSTGKKICSSCGTKKTPYWREGWEEGILLCNACGIRYQKYKKYCGKCIAIARKDDKGKLHCPECAVRL